MFSLFPFDLINNFSFTRKSDFIKGQRIIGLDVVRSMAILMVVAAHSSEFLSRLFNNPHIGHAVKAYVTFVQPFGQLGVELFFVLSGFLIGNILINTFMEANHFSFRDILHFWIRRWFRTLPVYWLILTVDTVLYIFLKLQSHETYKFYYYIFVQNLWYPHPRFFFGEAWSLSIEEWFYLTLPIALYLSFLLFSPVNKKKFLFRVFIIYLLVFVLIRVVNAFHPINGTDIDFGIRKVVVFRLDAVMYGVLFAWLHSFRRERLNRVKKYLFLACIAGVSGLYYLLTDNGVALCQSSKAAIFATNAFLYLFMPLFFSLCLPLANGFKNFSSRHISGFFRHISKISYSLYLVHYSLVFIPFFCFIKVSSSKSVVLLYLLYWVIIITLSSLLYKYFEYPVMRLRDRFHK